MKTDFTFVDGFALSSPGLWVDLHNHYDFLGVNLGWDSPTATLSWHRAAAEWVPDAIPRVLRINLSQVSFLLLLSGGEEDDWSTVAAVGYLRNDAPGSEVGFLPEQLHTDDHLVLMWSRGGFLRLYADSASLSVVP